MKILFLQDNGINESLAVTDVAGLLRSRGHECDLLIMRNERRFREKIARSGAGLVVVPVDIWGEEAALALAVKAKESLDAPLVFCGTYPLLFPEIVERPEVDLVVRGEAEFPILDIANNLEAGRSCRDVPNVALREGGGVVVNDMRPLIQDLSILPLPFRELYFKYWPLRQMSMKRMTSGRGCPNACSFCFNAKFKAMFAGKGRYVRRKPVDLVTAEIDLLKRTGALRSLHFSDDLFTCDRNWVLAFCEAYARAHSGLPFTCNTTIHDVDDEMLGEMKKAGCTGIAIGVETGNERLRMERLNKLYKDEEIRGTAAMIKSHGLFLTSFNMMALPYETLENAFETVRLNREIGADNVRVTFLSPIPRTKLVEDAVKDGLLPAEYGQSGGRVMTPEIETRKNEQFRTLYALVDIAVASPFLEKLVRRFINVRIPRIILYFLLLPRMYREKKFFNIGLVSGLIFYLSTTMPQYRTKNFNNFLP